MFKKSLHCLMLVAMLLFSGLWLAPQAEAVIAKPLYHMHVTDHADYITDKAERKIRDLGENLEKEFGAEVIVVAVKTLPPGDPAKYSQELFKEWGLDKAKGGAALLLVGSNARVLHVEATGKLEGKINGKGITDGMVKLMEMKKHSEAITTAYGKLASEVYRANGATMPDNYIKDLGFGGALSTDIRLFIKKQNENPQADAKNAAKQPPQKVAADAEDDGNDMLYIIIGVVGSIIAIGILVFVSKRGNNSGNRSYRSDREGGWGNGRSDSSHGGSTGGGSSGGGGSDDSF